MKAWKIVAAVWCVCGAAASADDGDTRVRNIILNSRHMGAHGLGYNTESMQEMAHKLRATDVPVLVRLLHDRDVSVGAEFGLASQCAAAIEPVSKAAAQKKADFLASEEVMELIGENKDCSDQAKKDAAAAKANLAALREAEYERIAAEARKREENDQRIQENGLKLMDPTRRGELTLEERKEVFERSVKAAGLEHPQTQAQKDLVDKMYRTMVLGESDGKKKPN
jgi:hypothetical protein